MKIALSAESTIDMPQELLDKYKIVTLPFGITFKDKLVEDHFGIAQEIFDFVNDTKVLPKTSAIPPEQYREYFENLKKEYDAIIHISLSSKLSSSYNNACLASEDMENVFVVDSKNLSTGIALVAIFARGLIDKKLEAEEVYTQTQEYVSKISASFVLDKLNYMHKGGRCSAVTLLGANLLKIKPQIVVSDGRMGVGKKYRGTLTKVIENYCSDVLVECENADKSVVFITHSSEMPEEEKYINKKLKEAGFKTIYNTYAGGTVCCHCGPNTIGILYANK